ncbi:MAG: OmpA family protein [Candidatus Kapabacteria bacterium]|nr:OmpA family protein [Candidatus Kapabacteria bacterium]
MMRVLSCFVAVCCAALAFAQMSCGIFSASRDEVRRDTTTTHSGKQQFDVTTEPTLLTDLPRYDDYIRTHAPADSALIALQRMAGYYVQRGADTSAATLYDTYSELFPDKEYELRVIRNLLRESSPRYVVRNMGSAINTPGDEFSPVLSAADYPIRLWFTTAKSTAARQDEDVMYSEFDVIEWREARIQGSPFGSMVSESPSGFNGLCTQMLFTRNSISPIAPSSAHTDKQKRRSCDSATQHNQHPENANIASTLGRFSTWRQVADFEYPVNTDAFDGDACFADGGKVLFFVSDRKGGIGGHHPKPRPCDGDYHGDRWGNTDIYVSIRTPAGWSEPINLGFRINTPFAERTPYMSGDGKTLYFSSDGHKGLGRLDVYRTERLNLNSWTEWSTPENMGKEINSSDDDWGYKESPDGDSAFFASRNRRGGFGGLDIYTARLAPPPPVPITIRGRISDYYNRSLVCDIRIMDATDDPFFIKTKTDSTGRFEVHIPRGRDYICFARKEGYYPCTKNFRIRANDQDTSFDDMNLMMMPMHDRPDLDTSVLHIENILFERNAFTVGAKYVVQLESIVEYIRKKKELYIEITGHTDSEGNPEYNLQLSKRRAEAVRKFLAQLGCDTGKLRVIGAGYLNPLAGNDTDEGRALNRRVEIRLMK